MGVCGELRHFLYCHASSRIQILKYLLFHVLAIYRMTKHLLAVDPTINSQVTVIGLVVVVVLIATILQACTLVVST